MTVNTPARYLQPTIHFLHARDGVRIAYWCLGEGDPPVLVLPSFPFSHLELEWELPTARRFYELLAVNHRVARFDWRGIGLSTQPIERFTLDDLCDDIDCLADLLGFDRFAIAAHAVSGLFAFHYAATRPARVSHLIVLHPILRGADYLARPEVQARLSLASKDWDAYADMTALGHVGWTDAATGQKTAEIIRKSISPSFLEFVLAEMAKFDVTEDLPLIQAATLAMHRLSFRGWSAQATSDLVASLPEAELAFLPGKTSTLINEEMDILPAIESFLSDGLNPHPMTEEMAQNLGWNSGHLTSREEEILKLLASGLSNKEIASLLSLSALTVQRHVANVYEKIGTRNRAEATAFAIRHRLTA